MTKFEIDLVQLDGAVDTMASFGRFVEDSLADVERQVSDLHLTWSSPAATAQRAAHDRWATGVKEMRENLAELREVARIAHTNYQGAVDTNSRMWP